MRGPDTLTEGLFTIVGRSQVMRVVDKGEGKGALGYVETRLLGASAASVIDSTGAKQTSVP